MVRIVRPSAGLLLALAGWAATGASAQPSYNVTLLGNLNQYPGTSDCWGYSAPNGVELAIWGHRDGTAFVDATDPANAVEIWNLPGPSSTWRDIKTYLHYAYIVTEGSGEGTGLQIVDLADPLNPVHVRTHTADGFTTAHNLWIDTANGVAYACGASPGGGLRILSLADPGSPVEIDFFNPYYIHDLWVGDGVGYAGAINTGSLRILDLADPANPVTVTSHFYAGAVTHNAWPNAARTHVLTTDEIGGGHVKIWNITGLPVVALESEYRVTSEEAIVHNVLLDDDMAYISYYAAGSRIVDVSDPAQPLEVGYYDTTTRTSGFDGCWGVYPFRTDRVYYASDRQNGLFLLEFTGDFAGEIRGTVRNAATSVPLDSARVRLAGTPVDVVTGGTGTFAARVSGGTWPAVTTRFGFLPDTTDVVIAPRGLVVHDVDLVPLPQGDVELTVLSSRSGQPVPGATVDVPGTPIAGRVADAQGRVMLAGLPAGLPWTVRAARFGLAVTEESVTPVAGLTVGATIRMPVGFSDDFDVDQGWLGVGPGDDATDGRWERAVPVGSFYGGIVGPDRDASPDGEGWAWVTENHVAGAFVGTSDVDGGRTTLLSPVFDGTGVGDLTLGYTRWFSNRAPSPGNDPFRVDLSTDGGATWTNLETVTAGTDSWSVVRIPLAGHGTPTASMQLRFVAEDGAPDHYVEAGVDDVILESTATAVPGAGDPVAALPAGLGPAVPNPFRAATRLEFELPRSGPVSLVIHDIAGRRVATLLAAERLGGGRHGTTWDGRDDAGRAVAPGVYFARLVTDEVTVSRKVTFVK